MCGGAMAVGEMLSLFYLFTYRVAGAEQMMSGMMMPERMPGL
jgi:hypothetical protein